MISGIPDGAVTPLKEQMDALTKKAGSGCDIFGTLGSMVSKETSAILADIQKGITEAMKSIGKVLKEINSVIDKAKEWVSKLMAKISELTTALIAKINEAFAAINAAINKVITAVTDAVGKIVGEIDKMFKMLGDLVSDMVAAGCKLVKGAITSIGAGVSDMVDSIGDTEEGAASAAAEAKIKEAASAALGTVGLSKNAMADMSSSFDLSEHTSEISAAL